MGQDRGQAAAYSHTDGFGSLRVANLVRDLGGPRVFSGGAG